VPPELPPPVSIAMDAMERGRLLSMGFGQAQVEQDEALS
jgi:hypothetical protein